jgi:hypothetical protein
VGAEDAIEGELSESSASEEDSPDSKSSASSTEDSGILRSGRES